MLSINEVAVSKYYGKWGVNTMMAWKRGRAGVVVVIRSVAALSRNCRWSGVREVCCCMWVVVCRRPLTRTGATGCTAVRCCCRYRPYQIHILTITPLYPPLNPHLPSPHSNLNLLLVVTPTVPLFSPRYNFKFIPRHCTFTFPPTVP